MIQHNTQAVNDDGIEPVARKLGLQLTAQGVATLSRSDVFVRPIPGIQYVVGAWATLTKYKRAAQVVSEERLKEHLDIVTALRVLQVRGEIDDPRMDVRRCIYPSILRPVFRAIGDVLDESVSLDLRVRLSDELVEVVKNYDFANWRDDNQMIQIALMQSGISCATCLPPEVDGNRQVLTLIVNEVEGQTRAEGQVAGFDRSAHPGEVLVGAILGHRLEDPSIFGAPRVSYQNVGYFEDQFYNLVNAEVLNARSKQ